MIEGGTLANLLRPRPGAFSMSNTAAASREKESSVIISRLNLDTWRIACILLEYRLMPRVVTYNMHVRQVFLLKNPGGGW